MKRIVVMVCAVIGLAASSGTCRASWGALCYSGYQPWYNIFAKRYKCMTPEEERLQKFWHDYYHAMKEFYCSLDHIDWVAYYKNHGYQINAGCGSGGGGGCCGRINYAPVFVNPSIQWAVPAGCAGGPPVGPSYAQGGNCPPSMMPSGPMGGMGGMGGMGAMGPMGPYGAMPANPGVPMMAPSGPMGGAAPMPNSTLPNPTPTTGSGGQ